MSEFNPAFTRTMGFEGITLEDVPGDPGGLTFCGIARNPQPNWNGWPVIDQYLDEGPDFATAREKAINDEGLMALVEQFYQASIWNQNKLSSFESQELANQVYDAVVNIGGRAVRALQALVSVANDGVVGQMTLNAVNGYSNADNLIDSFIHWRKEYYVALVQEKPGMQKFLDGWLKRCVRSDESPAV